MDFKAIKIKFNKLSDNDTDKLRNYIEKNLYNIWDINSDIKSDIKYLEHVLITDADNDYVLIHCIVRKNCRIRDNSVIHLLKNIVPSDVVQLTNATVISNNHETLDIFKGYIGGYNKSSKIDITESIIMSELNTDSHDIIWEEKCEPIVTFDETPDSNMLMDFDEVKRIRNSSNSQLSFPVHYIISDNDGETREILLKELTYELINAHKVESNRCIKISADQGLKFPKYGTIGNVKTFNGSRIVIDAARLEKDTGEKTLVERLEKTEAENTEKNLRSILNSIYSIDSAISNNYVVIIMMREDEKKYDDILKTICDAWPFVYIKAKKYNYSAAIKYLTSLLDKNRVHDGETVANSLIKANREYTRCELYRIFYMWYRNTYLMDGTYKSLVNKYFNTDQLCSNISALEQLNQMIGLMNVKKIIKRILDYYNLQSLRYNYSKKESLPSMHMVFTGNPGTAKTTVARLLAKILYEEGILKRPDIVECGRGDLVGKYVGWTAKNVLQKFEEARGGILFIDEAYSLYEEDYGFGKEAVNTLVQEMENNRNNVLVILAGYKKEMDMLLGSNAGMNSRINFFVEFEDYTKEEMYDILKYIAKREQYVIDDDVHDVFMKIVSKPQIGMGNGRSVRNIYEQAKLKQSSRLMELKTDKRKKELFVLCSDDFV